MSGWRRRSVLKTVASTLAGAGVVGQVAANDAARRRYVVDVQDVSPGRLDAPGIVETIHRLDSVDLAVVRGRKAAVERLGGAYEPDVWIPSGGRGWSPPTASTLQPDAEDEEFYAVQWDKQVQNVPDAHSVTRGEGTRVAVIDQGVQADHPDLVHAVDTELSRSFVNDGYPAGAAYAGDHGTLVAGVVAANDADDAGIVGTAPATEIVDCRAFAVPGPEEEPGAWTADILAAAVYSADVGCDVANISIGPPVGVSDRVTALNRLAGARIAAYASERGTLLVVAAGNNAVDLTQVPNTSFENAENLLLVSATGPVGFGWPIADGDGDGAFGDVGELEADIELERPYHEPAVYTNYGEGIIDVSAPGGNYSKVAEMGEVPGSYLDNVLSTGVTVIRDDTGSFTFENNWRWTVGTSFAAPQVAAAAALVRSTTPAATPADVRETLLRTAASVGDGNTAQYHGAGFLNPAAAVGGGR